ncbi:hypothetical protein H7I76_27055 [Mycolicibacterium vaccae]|nr:hypothetical protein [Mycolicibacterium vaccae]
MRAAAAVAVTMGAASAKPRATSAQNNPAIAAKVERSAVAEQDRDRDRDQRDGTHPACCPQPTGHKVRADTPTGANASIGETL